MATSLLNELKSVFLKRLASTTIHGLPRIVESKNPILRFIWLFCFMLSFGACIYYISSNMIEFFNYDETSQIQFVQESPVLFPAVEVCNSNPYQTEHALDVIINYLNENTQFVYDQAGSARSLSKLDFINQVLFDYPDLENHLTAYTNGLNKSEQQRLGFPLDSILLTCQFVADTCGVQDFRWNFRKNFGNCFTFNLHRKYYSIGPGETYKLRLEMFAGIEERLLNTNGKNHGLRLLVYNQSNFYLIADYGINAGAGTALTLAVKRVIIDGLEEPYSKCDFVTTPSPDKFNLTIYNLFVAANKTYSQVNCLVVCYRQLALSICECFDNVLKPIPENTTVKYCSTESEFSCISDLYRQIVLNKNDSFHCLNSCPLECSSAYFTFTPFYSTFAKRSYAELLLRNRSEAVYGLVGRHLTPDEFRKNLVQVNIYYESMSYEYISQSPTTTWVTLLANVGGVLGLFIGMSLLSLVELIEMCLHMLIAVGRRLLFHSK